MNGPLNSKSSAMSMRRRKMFKVGQNGVDRVRVDMMNFKRRKDNE